MYVISPGIPESIARSFSGIYRLIYNKYFVDEAYDSAIVHPMEEGSRQILWKGLDVGVIDGLVNGAGSGSQNLGRVLRWAQSGSVRNYAAWVVFGSILVLIAVGVAGGSK
jgi:NADH-quinone oxidoreductase subunit L